MARIHGKHRKGKSGSKKPNVVAAQPWVAYSSEEVEDLVIKLRKDGKSLSEIGTILRDQYGIPEVKLITEKSVMKILQEHNLAPKFPEDLCNLVKRALNIREHLEKNKKDLQAKRDLRRTESKIKRLVRYYKSKGVLAEDFRYSHKRAKEIIG